MPRQARESSGTGIYHVMMRGINHLKICMNPARSLKQRMGSMLGNKKIFK